MATRTYKPLRAALLIFDILRFVVLAFAAMFASFSSSGGAAEDGFFPFLVYLTPNALFPLMALFLLIGFREYKNYLPLYAAGKIITVITFYIWALTSFGQILSGQYLFDPMYAYFVLLGNFALSIGDLLSIFGTVFLLNRIKSFQQHDNSLEPADNIAVNADDFRSVDNGGL